MIFPFFLFFLFWDVSHKLDFALLNFCVQKDKKSDSSEYEGQEVLRVRAYGSSFFTLGINIRYPPFPMLLYMTLCFPICLNFQVDISCI